MLIAPSAASRKRHRQLLASLQRGDRIVTSGGLIGRGRAPEGRRGHGEERRVAPDVQRSNIANILNRSVEAAKPQ